MKKAGYILLLVFITATVVSCKKGEGDPAISFRTRKNRVTGNWHIKSGKYAYEETNASGTITLNQGFVYSSTGYTYTTGTGANTMVYIGGHTYTIKFDKNGYMAISEIFDGMEDSYAGYWDFNDGIGTAKAKENLILQYRTVKTSSGTKTYKGNQTDMTFSIVELRNKFMRIRAEDERTFADGSGYSYVEYYELVQD